MISVYRSRISFFPPLTRSDKGLSGSANATCHPAAGIVALGLLFAALAVCVSLKLEVITFLLYFLVLPVTFI